MKAPKREDNLAVPSLREEKLKSDKNIMKKSNPTNKKKVKKVLDLN